MRFQSLHREIAPRREKFSVQLGGTQHNVLIFIFFVGILYQSTTTHAFLNLYGLTTRHMQAIRPLVTVGMHITDIHVDMYVEADPFYTM